MCTAGQNIICNLNKSHQYFKLQYTALHSVSQVVQYIATYHSNISKQFVSSNISATILDWHDSSKSQKVKTI